MYKLPPPLYLTIKVEYKMYETQEVTMIHMQLWVCIHYIYT